MTLSLNSGKRIVKKRGKGVEAKRQKKKTIVEYNSFLEQQKNQQKRGVLRKVFP